MIPETFQTPFVLAVILALIVVLVTDKFKTSLVFLGGVSVLILGGSVSLESFISGVSNESVLTIFTLIVITAGINENFDLAAFFERLFGRKPSRGMFILRMGTAVSGVSSVMNNTPVVAMMMPYVYDWGKKHNINPSRLLMPLSYSAILGGVITLIGTSTNLVLNGLIVEEGLEPLGFSDFIVPGLLVTAACLIFMFFTSGWLLGDKEEILKNLEKHAREYLVETKLNGTSDITGKSVEDAGLRNLHSVFLTEIVRDDVRMTPVKPTQVLQEGDILLFAGDTENILKLIERVKGLELSKNEEFALHDDSHILEAVVTQNSQLDRRTVKQVGFREKFDAAIIGIHRQGERVDGKIGTVPLRTGDLLLLSAGPEFIDRNARTNDLLVINSLERKEGLPARHSLFFGVSLLAIVGLIIGGVLSLFSGLLLILLSQVALRMLSLEKIKQNISLDLLLILVSALAIGDAFITSGAADFVTKFFFDGAESWSPIGILAGVFGVTFVLTSLVTNVAAVTIVFPIAYSLAVSSSLSENALFLTAAFAASCCFATPFAYQTNLMVMEAGNYGFKDYVKFGLPVSLVYAIVFLTFAAFNYNLI